MASAEAVKAGLKTWGKNPALHVFLVSFVLLFIYLLTILQSSLFTDYLPPDQFYFLGAARTIALVDPLGPDPLKVPLYSYFVTLCFLAVGENLLPVIGLLQVIAGAYSVSLVFLLARRLEGTVAGWVAAGILLLYWPFVEHTAEILVEPLFLSFLLLSLYLLLLAGEKEKPSGLFFASGVSISVAALLRPNGMALLPAALLFLLMVRKEPLRRRLRFAGVLLCGVGLLLAVNTARNWANFQVVQPLSYQGGINFFIGNRPGSDGFSAGLPGLAPDWQYPGLKVFTEKLEGRGLSVGEVMGFWGKKARELAWENPGAVLGNLGRKCLLFFNNYEIPNTRILYQIRRDNTVLSLLPVDFAFLLGVFTLGAFWLQWRRPQVLLVAVTAATLSLGVIAFFVCSRYRLPVVPLLAVLAGAGVGRMARSVKEGRVGPRKAVTALVVAALLFAASLPTVFGVDDRRFRAEERKILEQVRMIESLRDRAGR